jgi:hypothetical protein
MSTYITNVEIPKPGTIGGGSWHLSDLSDFTILFGKNSSGKSLLLRAWRDNNIKGTHYIAPERTGEMNFNPGQIQTQMNPEGRSQQSRQNFSSDYRQQVITRITTYFAKRGAYRGEDLPKSDAAEIENLLNILMPDFELRLTGDVPPYELVRLSSGQKVGGVHELSSGEAQILTVGLDIITIAAIWDLQHQENRILLIDEPDAHIHPDLQTRFADFVYQVASKYKIQVVIGTHSTTLLASIGQLANARTSVIYLDRIRSAFSARIIGDVQRELASCLGGHLLMGPLFYAPLLLVEGDDDVRIWSQVPRHHIVNLSVIPCQGSMIIKYQRSLEQILKSLTDTPTKPFGIALLDGDKSLPVPNPDNMQKYVRFIRMNCREAENLYLCNEVLNLIGITWAEGLDLIREGSGRFGEKAELLKSASSWDRKTCDVKLVINELSMLLDKKSVHWTLRVGQCIGKARPAGQLTEFLGDDLVNALWGEISS